MMDYGKITAHFAFDGTLIYGEPFGHGHINDTHAVYFKRETKSPIRYILQRINNDIFRNVDQLMENIEKVTAFIAEQVAKEGGDPAREVLHVIPTVDGKNYYFDEEERVYYRAYDFIEDAVCLQTITKAEHFYQSAKAFGKFQKQLGGFPADQLHETIPRFHDTRDRVRQFEEAVTNDIAGRAASVQKEIAFIREREKEAGVLLDLLAQGKIPLRVTHNDTKLNNVMLDAASGQGLCVIDLDTVMPGLAHYDFGDSIRFGASTAVEDETDLSKVQLDLSLYEVFTRGFLEECGESLTPTEIAYLPFGAKMMTYECGMRFLADYLNGDTYFKIQREHQNLDRCRTQLKLVAEMEEKKDAVDAIIRKYAKC